MSLWVLIAAAMVVMAAVLVGNGIVRQRGERGLTNRAIAGIAAGLALAVGVAQIGGGLWRTTPTVGQAQSAPTTSGSAALPGNGTTATDYPDDLDDDEDSDDADDAEKDTSPSDSGPFSAPQGSSGGRQGAINSGSTSPRAAAPRAGSGGNPWPYGPIITGPIPGKGEANPIPKDAVPMPPTGGPVEVPPVAISSTSLPSATAYEAYRQQLRAIGGSGPYTWKLVSGNLPRGIKLSSAGLVSGTTTSAGTATFAVKVTGADGSSARRSFTVTSRLMVATQVAVGENHVCALTTKASIKCWGDNVWRQLGPGYWGDEVLTPRTPPGLTAGVKAIAAGDTFTCALTTAGGVKCWGEDYPEIPGWAAESRDNNDTISEPKYVVGLSSGVAAISAGYDHACALTTAGGVKCWGNNADGQLGNGTKKASTAPVNVVGLSSGVKQVAAGDAQTCAVLTAGGVKCWGWATKDDGTNNFQALTPRSVPASDAIATVSRGGFNGYACSVTTTGGALCWGNNEYGGLGNGTNTYSEQPGPVTALTTGVAQIATGEFHGCAVTTAGAALCWGKNFLGELGNGSTKNSATPTAVVGLSSGVREVAASQERTCALLTNGGIRCWGNNYAGALGGAPLSNAHVTSPVRVRGFP